jgi:tRNA(Ile)-lysidine synthase TilS/MesJ
MANAVFRDKIGGVETLQVQPGQTVRAVLRTNGIPANAVLTYVNGVVVAEDVAVIGPEDYVEFRQVRHYDLGITRDPPSRVYSTPSPIYTKAILFDERGDLEVRAEQLDAFGFVEHVEQSFVEGIEEAALIEPGVEIVTGLSGGRDSVAFLKLLERTRSKLPEFRMVAVTVTGTPDWEEPETFRAAQLACEGLGVAQVLVDADAIQDTFRLTRPYVEVMNDVVAGSWGGLNMVIGHHTLRRMVEIEAERRGASTVALGFNSDDLVATLVTWLTSGFRMGPIPKRQVGPFTYLFPLYRITKKELTLYLELVAPELNRQGPPGRFTTGPGERSLAYAVTDHLFDLWPGIDHYLFAAFANMQRSLMPPMESACSVCGATYLMQEGVANAEGICDVCQFFAEQRLSLPLAGT